MVNLCLGVGVSGVRGLEAILGRFMGCFVPEQAWARRGCATRWENLFAESVDRCGTPALD